MAQATLTTKQEQFVLAYIGPARYNATRAAQTAGYSVKTASEQGYQLLQHPSVSARIKELLSIRSLSAEAVLTELTDIATADWRDFVKVKTDPRTGEEREVSMDLTSKVKSLELLAKAHGLLTDRVDISGTMTSTVEIVGVDPEAI